jgi:heme/copper-type cytochrome/quinol oxidase subunit 2
MTPLLLVLLHDDGMDIIYFWSSIFMVALPLTIFSTLTYFVVRGYRRRKREDQMRNAECGMRN